MGSIDNTIYQDLGARWYEAEDDPVALLRAESKWRNPWVAKIIEEHFATKRIDEISVLDIACGGGFLSNYLAKSGLNVFGVDQAEGALSVAKNYDTTKSVQYSQGDARSLSFESNSMDVITMMDFLEHVDNPLEVIQEAKRVLRPGGLFFFHTFNRNLFAQLIAIKLVEWFVRNTPPDLHVIEYFIRPQELREILEKEGFEVQDMFGLRPKLFQMALWQILWTGKVSSDFEFCRSGSMLVGYSGFAILK